MSDQSPSPGQPHFQGLEGDQNQIKDAFRELVEGPAWDAPAGADTVHTVLPDTDQMLVPVPDATQELPMQPGPAPAETLTRREIVVDSATMCLNGIRLAMTQRGIQNRYSKALSLDRRQAERTERNIGTGRAARAAADLKSKAAPVEHAPATARQRHASRRHTIRLNRGMKSGVDSFNAVVRNNGIGDELAIGGRLAKGHPVAREDRRTYRKGEELIARTQDRKDRIVGEIENLAQGRDRRVMRMQDRAADKRAKAHELTPHLQYLRQQRQRHIDRLQATQSKSADRRSTLAQFQDLANMTGPDMVRSDIAHVESGVRTARSAVRQSRINHIKRDLRQPVTDWETEQSLKPTIRRARRHVRRGVAATVARNSPRQKADLARYDRTPSTPALSRTR